MVEYSAGWRRELVIQVGRKRNNSRDGRNRASMARVGILKGVKCRENMALKHGEEGR